MSSLTDHTVSEDSVVSSLVVRGVGSEEIFDMIHYFVELFIDEITVVYIDNFPKLPLFVKAHTSIADDSFFCTAPRDIISETVFHFVSITSDGGRGECVGHRRRYTFAINALFDGFLFECELVFVGDDLSFATSTSDLVFGSLGLEGVTTARFGIGIGAAIVHSDKSSDDFGASFSDDANVTHHTRQNSARNDDRSIMSLDVNHTHSLGVEFADRDIGQDGIFSHKYNRRNKY